MSSSPLLAIGTPKVASLPTWTTSRLICPRSSARFELPPSPTSPILTSTQVCARDAKTWESEYELVAPGPTDRSMLPRKISCHPPKVTPQSFFETVNSTADAADAPELPNVRSMAVGSSTTAGLGETTIEP
eukprot:1335562-Rhodomonas_salina.1